MVWAGAKVGDGVLRLCGDCVRDSGVGVTQLTRLLIPASALASVEVGRNQAAVECEKSPLHGIWYGMWQAAGECEKNPSYMDKHCAATCNTCSMMDYTKRCPMPDPADAAVPPGAMGEMFRRALLSTDYY